MPATCTVAGTDGNGLAIGELTTIVDPIPYVASVSNTTATEGGAEIESDADLAERVFLAPGAYSTAGPEDGYIYHAKAYSPAVGDVEATSDQEAGTVDIVFIMADGSTPGEEMIEGMEGYLQGKTIRPMTDLVRVAAPEEVQYTINLTYYINRSDSAKAVTIQAAVAQAVEDYKTWQRAIGRDVNPSQLTPHGHGGRGQARDRDGPDIHRRGENRGVRPPGEAVVTYGGWRMIKLSGSRFTDICRRTWPARWKPRLLPMRWGGRWKNCAPTPTRPGPMRPLKPCRNTCWTIWPWNCAPRPTTKIIP